MTTPSIKPALPAGTILSQHVEQDFEDFTRGRPLTQRVLISVVQVGGTASENQERGRSNKAKYETLHAVEITDTHKADHVRHLLTEARADRGYAVTQGALFASDDVDEQRTEVLGYITEWATEEGVDDDALTERWRSFHGGNYDARLESAAPAHLREFAMSVGALADSEPVSPADDEADADDPDDEGADDPEAQAERPVPAPAFSGAGPQ